MLPGKRGDTGHRKLQRHANVHKDTLSNPVATAWVSSGRMGWRLIRLQLIIRQNAMCRVALSMEPYADGGRTCMLKQRRLLGRPLHPS